MLYIFIVCKDNKYFWVFQIDWNWHDDGLIWDINYKKNMLYGFIYFYDAENRLIKYIFNLYFYNDGGGCIFRPKVIFNFSR